MRVHFFTLKVKEMITSVQLRKLLKKESLFPEIKRLLKIERRIYEEDLQFRICVCKAVAFDLMPPTNLAGDVDAITMCLCYGVDWVNAKDEATR